MQITIPTRRIQAALARLFLPALLVTGLGLPGCARKETAVSIGNREGILHLGNLSEPKDLDPHIVTGVTEHNIITALIEGLVAEDPETLEPVPGVAERWSMDAEARTYTFYLRPEAKWSNGDRVSAEDFVASYRRILSPSMGSAYAYMLFCLRNARAFNAGEITDFEQVGATALDESTLQLQLDNPTPYFLSLLNHYSWFPVHTPTILRFGAIDEPGSPWTKPGNFVGNGPFTLAEWEPGTVIRVVKSATYWDAAQVRLNEIHFHPIGDHNIEEHSFRAGQLHVTGTVPIDRIKHYRDAGSPLLRLDPYLGTYYYLFNVNRPPLDNPKVRLALAMAINRNAIVNHVVRGGEQPAHHFTPPGTAGYTAAPRVRFDLDRARELLAEAGYPNGDGFPSIELMYNTSDAHARIAQVVQQMWKQGLGLNIGLVNMEWKVYLANTQSGKYDIARAGWIGDYMDPNTFLDMWVTDGGNNRAGWSSPAYDALIAEAARTLDPEARFSIFAQAEDLLMQECPILPLYFYRSKSLIQPSVRGWHPTILDHHPYKHVYLDPGVEAAP